MNTVPRVEILANDIKIHNFEFWSVHILQLIKNYKVNILGIGIFIL